MRKKILYPFLLIVAVGIFVLPQDARAQSGTCRVRATTPPTSTAEEENVSRDYCQEVRDKLPDTGYEAEWTPNDGTGTVQLTKTPPPPPASSGPSTSTYTLLEPLPDPFRPGEEFKDIQVSEKNALGRYLNIILRLAIGLAAVLAVVMIVFGGIQYMTSELVHSKEAGKQRITNAVLGLLVALGAYLILFTVNPNLLDTAVDVPQVKIQYTADEANWSLTERTESAVGGRYVAGPASPEVLGFISRNGGSPSLSIIVVDTGRKTASFCVASGDCVQVQIEIGRGGMATAGEGQPGDLKTPKGVYAITADRRIGSGGNAIISRNGYNLGAAFINIGVTDKDGNNRGIGFHGSYNDQLTQTNGCVRMRNGDLLALAPFMRAGTQVVIQ
jgi:lipoprotein-anchoring transpeptidase ErfK/SrfK